MSLDWLEESPSAEEYVALREHCGLSPKTVQAAEIGLANSLYVVSLKDGDALAGFARLVGDGGCYVQLVDVMVRAGYRGHGYGAHLVQHCLAWAKDELPESCYLSLIADARAESLYLRAGFKRSVGMELFL
ncbi:GNAT family N-acetyltransferase [Pelagovum pacificum]|uniref:GNAT family N-acetyltransferase n=1 Tax=Pelagovum pacificum TaxID=2588711 RepID=A0A5C5GEN2_9RHOB|nr:GNAT family N-acetyltransferase [Pelagovum pacificum]QQA43706.1 GNAT family N-acetyltransferase [Pelagovum pacificum]TNY33163.1 GNAT family N-acetyltransferase [Pelagovum pacificum]